MPEAKEHWHLSRSVTISTLLSIFILFASQLYSYGKSQEKLETLSKKVEAASQDVIRKSAVEQMLKNRDIQIKNLDSGLRDVKQNVKENQKLLIQILQKMPRENRNR